MTITNLSDLAAATSSYIDNEVDVTVTDVTSNLQPGEDGTFTVHVTNAAAPTGVRLTDVNLHLLVDPPGAVKLKAPGSALLFPRATADTDDPRLATGEEVDSMFVFFQTEVLDEFNDTLDVGEELDLEFEYHAEAVGRGTIKCHVHANVDVDRLFPRSSGTNGSSAVRVIA
jgi:hypothetical protein